MIQFFNIFQWISLVLFLHLFLPCSCWANGWKSPWRSLPRYFNAAPNLASVAFNCIAKHACQMSMNVHQLYILYINWKKTTYIPMTSNNINSNTIHNTTWCRFDQSPLTSPGADLTLQLLHSFCQLICSGIHWFGHHLGGITLWSLKNHRICVKSLQASHILLRIFQFLHIPQNSNKACQDVKSDSNQSKNCHCQSTGDDTTRPGAGPFQSDPHLVLSSVRWKSKKKWLNGW